LTLASTWPDGTIRTPLPGDATGAEVLKEVWAVLLRAFPDLHLMVEDLIRLCWPVFQRWWWRMIKLSPKNGYCG
jgi:hypothetical protein